MLPLSVSSTLYSLSSSSRCLRLPPRLPVRSVLPSIFCSSNLFYKAVPTQDVTNQLDFFFLFVGYSSPPPWLYVTLLLFSHDRSNWSPPSFSNATCQNVQVISDPLSELANFQHHTKLYSKCNFSLVSFLNLRPICWWQDPSSSRKLLLPWQSRT